MTSGMYVLTQDVLVACILLGLTTVVGLLGNLLMLRALLRYKHLRIDFFLLLGSLAMADILCLAISVPSNIIYLTMATSPVTDAWCKASKYLEVGSNFVAAYHLVVLAVLRGILLTSRGHNPPTPCQTVVCMVVVWIIAMLAAVPFLFTIADDGGYCNYTLDTDIERDVWLLHSFSCFVPIALIMGIYLLTLLVGKRFFEDSYSYREKQKSLLVTIIFIAFVVCQLPYRTLDLHTYYKEVEAKMQRFPDEDMLESLYITRNYLLCLMMADKAARPIIYSKLAPQLSEAFDEVINCTLCHRAYTQGRTRSGNRQGGGRKANGHAARIPSTSSSAPLTGGSETGNSVATTETRLTSIERMEVAEL